MFRTVLSATTFFPFSNSEVAGVSTVSLNMSPRDYAGARASSSSVVEKNHSLKGLVLDEVNHSFEGGDEDVDRMSTILRKAEAADNDKSGGGAPLQANGVPEDWEDSIGQLTAEGDLKLRLRSAKDGKSGPPLADHDPPLGGAAGATEGVVGAGAAPQAQTPRASSLDRRAIAPRRGSVSSKGPSHPGVEPRHKFYMRVLWGFFYAVTK